MKPLERSIQINAPINRVFALCTNFERAPDIFPSILKVEMLTPGPVVVGTKFRETRKMFGKEATEEMTVTSLVPNQEVGLSANNHGCLYVSKFLVERSDGGTKLTMTFCAKPLTLFAKIMSKLMFFMRGMMTKMLCQDLEQIKKRAEIF